MTVVQLSREEAGRLYERFAHLPANHMYRGDGGWRFFTRALFDSALVIEMNCGLLRFTDFVPKKSMRVHALFDSKEVFRSVEELQAAGQYVFDVFGIDYIAAVVPAEKRALARLLERVGFRCVRTLRKGLYNGTIYVDGAVYHLRRDE
jgi:hypothetical protein